MAFSIFNQCEPGDIFVFYIILLYTNLYSRSPHLYQQGLWTPVLFHIWHSENSSYAMTEETWKKCFKSSSTFILKQDCTLRLQLFFLTLPPPTTFSAAYTVFPQRGHTSEPPAFWANLEELGLFVGRWGACLPIGGGKKKLFIWN